MRRGEIATQCRRLRVFRGGEKLQESSIDHEETEEGRAQNRKMNRNVGRREEESTKNGGSSSSSSSSSSIAVAAAAAAAAAAANSNNSTENRR